MSVCVCVYLVWGFEFSGSAAEQKMQYGAVRNQISQRLTASDVFVRLEQKGSETARDK